MKDKISAKEFREMHKLGMIDIDKKGRLKYTKPIAGIEEILNQSLKDDETLEFIVKDIPKVSYNAYNNYHWTKQKKFKDQIKEILQQNNLPKLDSKGYNLFFEFYFKGRKIDTINVGHYVKRVEDYLFTEDKNNGKICMQTFKAKENYFKLRIEC